MSFDDQLILFTDASVNTQSKVGYGAYLVIRSSDLNSSIDTVTVKTKEFRDTSSTKLELQILLLALGELLGESNEIVVYTDSQNIVGLGDRREALQRSDYKTKANKLLNNYELYKQFFQMTDQLNCQFIKVKGHQPTKNKNNIDRWFTLVDRAARKALKFG